MCCQMMSTSRHVPAVMQGAKTIARSPSFARSSMVMEMTDNDYLEYDDLSEVERLGADFANSMLEKLSNSVLDEAKKTLERAEDTIKKDIRKRIEDLYIDEVLSEVVERLDRLLEPKVMEAIKREVNNSINRLRESNTQEDKS